MKAQSYPAIKLTRAQLDQAVKDFIIKFGIGGAESVYDLGEIRFIKQRARSGVSKITGVKVHHA